MIVAAPDILSPDWLLIGRQEDTGFGGRIDLLALAPDASLVLIELKRDRTPREVIAQALDYASWMTQLEAEDVAAIFRRFCPGQDLAEAFRIKFGEPLSEEDLNATHQIAIVATELDASTERIVEYLAGWDLPVNVLYFRIFQSGEQKILSRAWLLDPVDTQAATAAGRQAGDKEPWNGEVYVTFGEGETRSWEEARKYGFVCAGGKPWFGAKMQLLSPGDRIWVNVPRRGYVGVGRVTGEARSLAEFIINGQPAIHTLDASYHREYLGDEERMEYFVPVHWLDAVPLNQAFAEVGLFGNQNPVAKPRTPKWRTTVERLRLRFPNHNSS